MTRAAGFHLAGEGRLHWRYRYSPLTGWHAAASDGSWHRVASLTRHRSKALARLRELLVDDVSAFAA